MKKRVLITGANGFIGGYLFDSLINTGWQITPLTHRKTGLKNEITIDFCDSDFVRLVNSLPKVDAVVHLGAKVGWDGASRGSLFTPNVLATAELAGWAKENEAHFIFASAAIVCGVNNSYISSESKPDPDTDYGYSKWLAEEVIKMSGVKNTILRIGGVFGKNGPLHLGVNKAIDGALSGIAPALYGTGRGKRNYIYVKDLALVIKSCIEKQIEGVHLIAGSSVNTVSQMLQVVCDVLLPGKKPYCHKGSSAEDKLIESSRYFPKGRLFEEAIKDIKNDASPSI